MLFYSITNVFATVFQPTLSPDETLWITEASITGPLWLAEYATVYTVYFIFLYRQHAVYTQKPTNLSRTFAQKWTETGVLQAARAYPEYSFLGERGAAPGSGLSTENLQVRMWVPTYLFIYPGRPTHTCIKQEALQMQSTTRRAINTKSHTWKRLQYGKDIEGHSRSSQLLLLDRPYITCLLLQDLHNSINFEVLQFWQFTWLPWPWEIFTFDNKVKIKSRVHFPTYV